ncbi:hypothetical protein F5Y05DRAFT_419727 [Hypoxylon sp. FL0543]|nr:hypothetical protein F5Y05DRAFT_419727 [Hypoxylon sp. FL0543]
MSSDNAVVHHPGQLLRLSNLQLEERQESSETRASFLALPAGLRLQIYEELFDWPIDLKGIIERNLHLRKNHLALLLACKKVYVEAKPIVYRAVSLNIMSSPLILRPIRPHNLALIQHATFTYDCLTEYNILGLARRRFYRVTESQSEVTHQNTHRKDWAAYFDELAAAGLNPKQVTIVVCRCKGAYRDWKLLKLIGSRFAGVRQIELRGAFLPLWAYSLRRRLGFTILRDGPGSWCLLNPAFYYSTAGYAQSSNGGVYDKICGD